MADTAERLAALEREMRTIQMVAGQCAAEGNGDTKSLMAAAESERCRRWADEIAAIRAAQEALRDTKRLSMCVRCHHRWESDPSDEGPTPGEMLRYQEIKAENIRLRAVIDGLDCTARDGGDVLHCRIERPCLRCRCADGLSERL